MATLAEDTGRLLTVLEVAERLHLSRSKTYELLDAEDGIPSIRIGSARRIDPADLQAFVDRSRVGG